MHKVKAWTAEYSANESLDILREIALRHALRGGQEGAKLVELIRKDRVDKLCTYDLDFQMVWNPEELFHCRQAVAFFSKLEHLDIGVNKERETLKVFLETETRCKETNDLFALVEGGFASLPRDVSSWIYSAQRYISRVLGPNPPSWEKLRYRFGPGATTLTKKRDASIRSKIAAGAACSEELLPAAAAVLGELPALAKVWSDSSMENEEESWYSVPVAVCDGSLEFVPKKATILRITVTEPPLNGLVQLPQGDDLAVRMKRFGVDLRDQSLNQRLACIGSLTDELATSDQSSASDLIATGFVRHMLPLDWFHYFARSRTGHVKIRSLSGDDIRWTLSKFSSMGNGYTFPLESLIFWALARAVVGDDEIVSVYGDDVILPSRHYEDFVRLMEHCGFKPNVKKSYSKGPFRESCGADYYLGIPVRPYFQKKWVSPETLFVLHNFYVRRGDHEDAAFVRGLIDPSLWLFGPDGHGDGHLLGVHSKRRDPRHDRVGMSGYFFDTFVRKPREDFTSLTPEVEMVSALYQAQGSGENLIPKLAGCKWDWLEYQFGPPRDEAAMASDRETKRINGLCSVPAFARTLVRGGRISIPEKSPLPERCEALDEETSFWHKGFTLPALDDDRSYEKKSIYIL